MSRPKTFSCASQLASLAVVLAVVDRDEPDAGLDQPAGQEHALAELGAAVAVAEPRVFRGQVERLPHRRRVEQAEAPSRCRRRAGRAPRESASRRGTPRSRSLPRRPARPHVDAATCRRARAAARRGDRAGRATRRRAAPARRGGSRARSGSALTWNGSCAEPRKPATWPGSCTTLYITCGRATNVGRPRRARQRRAQDRAVARRVVAVVAQELEVPLERVAAAQAPRTPPRCGWSSGGACSGRSPAGPSPAPCAAGARRPAGPARSSRSSRTRRGPPPGRSASCPRCRGGSGRRSRRSGCTSGSARDRPRPSRARGPAPLGLGPQQPGQRQPQRAQAADPQ